MKSLPYWSISDWSTKSRVDPCAAADHFYDQLKRLPVNQVKTAIARTQTRKDLIQAFELSTSNPNLPLSGVPYLLKDLYDVAGWDTTASSLFLHEVRPAPQKSSALAQAFDQAGGVFAGKTHLVEFAYGMEGSNSHFGDGVHPQFPERVSGGSSSGSVWAVASGLVPLASGSDTGGSVRVPAAYNGLYGLRVTPDHPWSKDGCFPLSPSLDTAGWFTRTADDIEITIDALFQTTPSEQTNFNGIDLLPNYAFLDNGLSIPHQEAVASLSVSTNPEATREFNSLPDLVKAYLITSSAIPNERSSGMARKPERSIRSTNLAKNRQWETMDGC
ncbi:MAG: amidase [Verrucomicrobia bacterium]|nr:amidase [Verrucomicrobiota bacterium]